MKEYIKKYGVRVGVIVASVALIIALSSAARGGQISLLHNISGVLISPVQKVVSSAVNWFDTIYGYLYQYDSLLAENESLRSQLADAQQSARDGIAASEENTRLRRLLNLREKHSDYVFESCKVVLWSSSNWGHTFTISKGASSGIELGDPVVTEYGAVVGQVTELGETWATVSTLIDVDMSVGAFVGDTGTSGIVMGEYSFMKNKQAKLTFLADGAHIYVGDEVLTSGNGGAFPQGLVIGKITAVQTEAGGQIEYGVVEPQVVFDTTVLSRFFRKDLFRDFLTPRRLRRVLWYGVYMLLVLVLQDMVLTQIRPAGVCAFVPPAAVTAVAMFEGAIPGVVFALVLGIFTDMFTPGTVVTYTVLFPIIAFGVGILAQFFVNRRFMGFMLLAVAALLLTALTQTVVIALKSSGSFAALWTAILQTLWTLPVAALVYLPPARWIE